MPIKKENIHLYPPPKEWKAIREEVLERAGYKCERCGIGNHEIGYRGPGGVFWTIEHSHQGDEDAAWARSQGYKVVKIVLTTAHVDQDPTSNGTPGNRPNLEMLCQKCHNDLDRPFRMLHAKETRIKKNPQQRMEMC